MTAQISDTFIYENQKYECVYLDGTDLVKPEDYGMKTSPTSSACWRGFYSTYEINNNQLILQKMVVSAENDNYLPINGVSPSAYDPYQGSIYENINLKILFTGKIRIAKDFIKDLYIHMGFQKGTSFETLLEFNFFAGELIEIKDLSEENRKKRGKFKDDFDQEPFKGIYKSFMLFHDDLAEENKD